MESGRFSRGGKQQTAATAGIVILANIPLDADGHPRFGNFFLNLPEFLRETAFIDRIHGILASVLRLISSVKYFTICATEPVMKNT